MEIVPVPTCCKLHAHNYTCIPKIIGLRGILDPSGQLVYIRLYHINLMTMNLTNTFHVAETLCEININIFMEKNISKYCYYKYFVVHSKNVLYIKLI